jgi:hypothetical protein
MALLELTCAFPEIIINFDYFGITTIFRLQPARLHRHGRGLYRRPVGGEAGSSAVNKGRRQFFHARFAMCPANGTPALAVLS